jgi:DNA-binding transcriptional regulator YhcF (GntR family)
VLIVVDPSSGVPVYRQLMEQVRLLVAGGRLRPGDELPSTRALSVELGINPMTISKAYNSLEKDGVVERRPGRPLVVRPLDAGELRERRREQLRAALAPAVTTARQLEIGDREAVSLFESLLEEDGGKADE